MGSAHFETEPHGSEDISGVYFFFELNTHLNNLIISPTTNTARATSTTGKAARSMINSAIIIGIASFLCFLNCFNIMQVILASGKKN